MKADCGGAAALLGAFEAAVEIGTGDQAVHLLLCLAENAIGPGALRNDDVSGRARTHAITCCALRDLPSDPFFTSPDWRTASLPHLHLLFPIRRPTIDPPSSFTSPLPSGHPLPFGQDLRDQ